MTGMPPRLLLIELNEFDPVFLRSAAARLGLRSLQALLNLPHATTTTADLVEHDGLDPWVQWVGVHSGVPSHIHGIKRLSQTSVQMLPQIWTKLGDSGFSWGVWGAMNAPRQSAPGCAFFFPDPWSFEERAFPQFLNDFLALPRYMSKNYFRPCLSEVMARCVRFAFGMRKPVMLSPLFRLGLLAMERICRGKLSLHACVVLHDYFSGLAFAELRRIHRPNFSLLFLNSIAHLQHQFWKAGEAIDPEMEFGLRLVDAICEKLIGSLESGEALVLVNGLRQRNVDGLGICGYRQINPQAMIEIIGIKGGVVEQCMTNDAHILFRTPFEADAATAILQKCALTDGTRVFFVERLDPTRIFFRSLIEHRVGSDEHIRSGDRSYLFADLMQFVCYRTGAHVPDGDVFARGVNLPPTLANHEVHDLVLAQFADHRKRSASEAMRCA